MASPLTRSSAWLIGFGLVLACAILYLWGLSALPFYTKGEAQRPQLCGKFTRLGSGFSRFAMVISFPQNLLCFTG